MELTTSLRYLVEWALLSVVLFAGLSFLSRSRGNRVLRGLLIAVLVSAVVLFGLSYVLGLEELEYVMRGAFSAALVVLAVVFQPELRKAFAELGSRQTDEHQRVQRGALAELARAAATMSEGRVGALVALEAKHPLDPWIHGGEPVEAPLRAGLLESLFAKESRLHDGAVIVRQGRVEAAACVLPLSDRDDLPAHFGTRHRAAMGLSEETDAVLLVVSEESGTISLFQDGKQLGPFAAPELEAALRRAMGASLRPAQKRGPKERLLDLLRGLKRDGAPLLGSLGFASLLLLFAHGELAVKEELQFKLLVLGPRDPAPGNPLELVLRVPDDSVAVRRIPEVNLEIQGTRVQLERFRRRARAELNLAEPTPGPLRITPGDLSWNVETLGFGLRFKDGLELELEAQGDLDLVLTPGHLEIDASGLDSRFELDLAATRFEPSQVRLVGPKEAVQAIAANPDAKLLKPIRLSPADTPASSRELPLSDQARAAGLKLMDASTVRVLLSTRPVVRPIGTVAREIALVCLDPSRRGELERWSLPAHSLTASFVVVTRGLLPVESAEGGTAGQAQRDVIMRFVQENLFAYVDLAELPLDGSRQVLPVRTAWRQDWQTVLWKRLFGTEGPPTSGEQLILKLDIAPDVRLEQRAAAAPTGPGDD